MATITCKIPAELNARLEAAARRQRVSKSAVIRQLLEASFSRTRKAPRPTGYDPTGYDLAKHLAGSLHGPPNLSTNPKYMEGFGA
jgi:hypothetical protein